VNIARDEVVEMRAVILDREIISAFHDDGMNNE
jgi:hypothetical protein